MNNLCMQGVELLLWDCVILYTVVGILCMQGKRKNTE